MKFDIEAAELNKLQKDIYNLAEKELPYGVMVAMNNSLFDMRTAVQKAMPGILDRPTPKVMAGILYRRATKEKPEAELYIAGKAAQVNISKILEPHITGGSRETKTSERSLRFHHPHLFKTTQYVRPGAGAKLDRYGNITGPEMVKIKSAARAAVPKQNQTGRSRRRNKGAYKDYFVIPYKGVFARVGPNSIIPILVFTRKPIYKKRFAFHDIAEAIAHKSFEHHFARAWTRAISTSK